MGQDVVRFENVSKEYRLGEYRGASLSGELQSWWARRRHREDPNSKIGENPNKMNRFLAVDDVSLSVKEGEALGIIGRNGAGKSTMLKLLSRVTAPTKGRILLKGRVASILEVGTGFHPELTGRENVYLNGAILGMSRREMNSKFSDIVAFAEMEQFIDTPVKRYSSGMYVKLAFAIAAHLDSEIMIMDEVLAVGDIRFQQKCLGRMSAAAHTEGRTVIYVSHNMRTVRQLCNRCIVLNKGQKIFEGSVDEAISVYANTADPHKTDMDLTESPRHGGPTMKARLTRVAQDRASSNVYEYGDALRLRIYWKADTAISGLSLRIHLYTADDLPAGVIYLGKLPETGGSHRALISLDTSFLAPARYKVTMIFYETNLVGAELRHDCVNESAFFEIVNAPDNRLFSSWRNEWGNSILTSMGRIVEVDS